MHWNTLLIYWDLLQAIPGLRYLMKQATQSFRGMSNTWPPCFLTFCKLHFGILYRAFCTFTVFLPCNQLMNLEHFVKFSLGLTFWAFCAFCETAIMSCILRFFSFWPNSKQVSHFVLFPLFAILAKWKVLHLVLFLKQQSSPAFCTFSAFCHIGKVTKSTAFSGFSAFCETAITSCILHFFSFWANYKQVSHFVLFPLFALLLFVKQQSSPTFCAFSAFGNFVMETNII